MVPQYQDVRLKGALNLMKYGTKAPSSFQIPFGASQQGRLFPEESIFYLS